MTLAMDLIRIFLSSMVGTLGFAAILHAPRQAWIPSALLGGASYTLYWLLMHFGVTEPTAIFIASMTVSLLAQFCARRIRMIATIFVALSLIPLVPGLGLYRAMELLGQGRNAAGLQAGIAAMISIMMIALGLAVGAFIFRAVISIRHHRRKEGS